MAKKPTSAPIEGQERRAGAEVEALVLCDCAFGQAGSVVTLSAADAQAGSLAGTLDLAPAAVAHAKS